VKMELEVNIENEVVAWAKKKGFLTPKVRFVEVGYPDRLFISPTGHTIFLEFKRPGKKPEPIQAYRINELNKRGIPAFWCDTAMGGLTILAAALEPETLSGEGHITPIRAGVSGALSGPGTGQDVNNPGDVQDPQGEGVREQAADSGSSETGVQGLAGRDKEVE
jgi:hypothetical protein